MKTITSQDIEDCLRRDCVISPITIPKIVRTFKDKPEHLTAALNIFAQGLLANYHMIPGNGSMEF